MSEVSSVSQDEWDVWRAFFRMRRHLDLALERQLQHDAEISGPDYEILLALFESPDKQLRARELGTLLGWEKSRLSHQVTRMERRGLVQRTECDTDARGTWIGITADGSRATLGAMRDHALSIRRFFFDVLTDEEKRVFKDVSGRVMEVLDPSPCAESDDAELDGAALEGAALEEPSLRDATLKSETLGSGAA
ncbi:MAG: MarR family transcriptional regulator [Glaciihabitans sp.]|jgi:DNA-binding MarR family transcriptional regulator|nr:MarR family transcriptional regulator [Glaciihabitans sp.]